MKLMFAAGLFAATSAAALAQAPAGSAAGQNTAPSSQQQQQQPRQPATSAQQNSSPTQGEQTITGCLTAADNIYTLTVMDDSGTPGTTVSTTAYTLAPGTGVDLQPHVNKRVTVKGTDAGPGMQASTRVEQRTPPAPAGTSGTNADGRTPTVETTAKARINAKTLNVSDVQPASGSCGAQ